MTGCCFKGCLPRREQAKPAKPAEKKVATSTGASEVEVVALQEEWCELKDTEQESGQEHFKQFANEAMQARERRLTAGLEVLNRAEEAGIPLGDMDVEVIEQSHEWGDAIPDSDEEGEEAAAQPALERLATSTFEARERRLTVGAEVLQLAQQPGASSGSKDDLDRAPSTPQQRDTGGAVKVVAQSSEWGGMVDSDEDVAPPDRLTRLAADASLARERRLTAGAEAITLLTQATSSASAPKGAVVQQAAEWQGLGDDSDGEASPEVSRQSHAAAAHVARERRLTAGAEAIAAAQAMPASASGAVAVVSEGREWAELEEEDEEEGAAEHHASAMLAARERRLTVGAEAVAMAAQQASPTAAQQDVAIVAESQEWAELEEEGEDAAEGAAERHASEALAARERRLTAGAEALALAGQQLNGSEAQGRDVAVVAESREWGELGEDEEEEDADCAAAERHAASAMAARERRLTAGAEAIAMAAQLPAAAPSGQDIAIVAESKEWGELEEDEETADGPSAAEMHASGRMAARERRLTVGAEAIAAAQAPAANERDVAVVVESKEWAELDDDDEDAGSGGAAEQHATAALAARERRLTAGAEALALAGAAVASRETAVVVTQSGEWGDDDSDEEPSAAEQHASNLMAARERRLTAGAEAIARLAPAAAEIGERDVAVVSEEKEWAELDDEEEDQGGAAEQHATSALAARERRLTAGAEALALAGQLAAPLASGDVALVAEGKEWAEDDDDDEAEEGAAERHASSQLAARERRLTAGAEAISAAAQLGAAEDVGQRDVAVVESGEWAELEEEEDEAGAAEQHASARLAARERRLTAGAEAIALAAPRPDSALAEKDVAVVAESQEWAELDSDEEEGKGAAERHASEKLAARERRLTAGAEALALSGQLAQESSAPKDVELVTASTEWGELGGDSDEEGPEMLARHAAGAHGARERRLTAGAEAIAMAGPQLAGEAVAKDVAVVEQEQEWGEGDSEEEELDRHAASAHQARERRLTVGAEAVALAGQALPTAEAAAKDVAIVDASAEWGELEDDSEGEDGPPAEDERCRRASASHQARERRLSAGAEVLQLSG